VNCYQEEDDPQRYYQASWATVRKPYLNAFQYRFALMQAETACQLAPERFEFLATIAMAHYRLGQEQQAQATLDHLRDAMKNGNQTRSAELKDTLHQAESLIERGNSLIPATPRVGASEQIEPAEAKVKPAIQQE
jgi:hypothetical protein